MKHIVEDNYDDILNNVVRDIGNEKFYISVQAESLMENNPAVHPVGNDVAYDIASIKVQIVIGAKIGAEPGYKGAIKGVDTADNEKEEKFLGKKMMLCFVDNIHR